jgi:hypothetical protein
MLVSLSDFEVRCARVGLVELHQLLAGRRGGVRDIRETMNGTSPVNGRLATEQVVVYRFLRFKVGARSPTEPSRQVVRSFRI